LQTQGLYPKVHIDVEVSSGEDDVMKIDALADKRKALDGDDAESGERLLLSRSLLTRSGPTRWNKSIPPSLIGLPQLFLLLAGVGASIPRLLLGGINHFLQQIR
jgi:hypothetical protein